MNFKDMWRVYQAVVVSQIMYRCLAWSIAKNTGLGYIWKTMNTLNRL